MTSDKFQVISLVMTTLSASAPLFITERVQAAGATIRLSQARTMIESVLAELMLGEFKPK